MPKWPNVDHGVRRFAVLAHTGIAEPHYDLLFETAADAPLTAFRLAEWPLTDDQPVTKLSDHRRLYLTYEGPVPADRGRVDRVADGTLGVIESASGWLLSHSAGRPFLLLEPRADESGPQWWVTLLGDGKRLVGGAERTGR